MSTECLREVPKRVGLSRLYHGSIMYLSRCRLWVSIMYLSGVVHTSAQGHRRHLSVTTFCRNQSAPVGAFASSAPVGADVPPEPVGTCRCRTFCLNYVGTGRNRPVQSSDRTDVIVGTCGVTLCHNVVSGLLHRLHRHSAYI